MMNQDKLIQTIIDLKARLKGQAPKPALVFVPQQHEGTVTMLHAAPLQGRRWRICMITDDKVRLRVIIDNTMRHFISLATGIILNHAGRTDLQGEFAELAWSGNRYRIASVETNTGAYMPVGEAA